MTRAAAKADTEVTPLPHRPDLIEDVQRALRATFPAEAVGKLPRSTCRDCSNSPRKRCDNHSWVSRCPGCGGSHSSATIHLDYVGHADVTARLLEVDPAWTWRPFSVEEVNALPPSLRGEGLWIHLTVGGVTRPGFGDAAGKSGGNAVKEAIGDALRNAAMRFGVALDLWAKGDREWAHTDRQDDPNPGTTADSAGNPFPPQPPSAPPVAPLATTDDPGLLSMTAGLLTELSDIADRKDRDLAWITAKLRREHGDLPVEALNTLHPSPLAELVDKWNGQAPS